MDKTEVTNINWREYLYYLSGLKKNELEYEKALPDTLVWGEDSMYNYYINYYFRHPSTNFYPVVGVSYEQAVDFCKWRTHAANQLIYFQKNGIKDITNHLADSFPIHFYYRLPAKDEWEVAAMGGVDTSISNYGGVEERFPNKCCYYIVNGYWDHINRDRNEEHKLTEFRLLNSKVLFPNKYGIYTYIGNAAEMVFEKGIAKGGSFIHPLDSCRIPLNQYYSKPEKWLGFRCVAVKIN